MSDYEVGYRKPPKATRFKPGKSGNPKGRPKRDQSLGKIVNDVLDEPIQYDENGRKRTGTRREVALKSLIERAMKGDIGAADILYRKRAHAMRRSDTGVKQLLIQDPLPDYPGQTPAQKARELGSAIGIQVITIDENSSPFDQSTEADGDLEQSGVIGAADDGAD